MILITGATGNLGTSVTDQLLKITDPDKFSALARNAEKASSLKEQGIQVRIADFNDVSTLATAFQGVKKLLLISTMDMNRLKQHENVVDAAVKSGVEHIIYTGLSIKDINTSGVKDLMISHFQTEDYIKQSGLTYTFVRNTMYADAIPQIVGHDVVEGGIFLPGGEGKVPYALRREMGEGIANLLLQDGHENKTYDITGSNSYSYNDIAQELSLILNKSIKYIDADAKTFANILKKSGVPEFAIYLLAGTVYDIKEHQYEIESNILESLLGRPTASLNQFLREVYDIK